MSDSREKIAKRIRALAAMTTANGCTEEEAVNAAAILARLLKEHNMTVDEAQMREQPFAKHREYVEDAVGERLWKPADGIAHLTGCRYWSSPAGLPPSITFFGFDHEVEIARYLLDICRRAMTDGEKIVRRSNALVNEARRRRRVYAYLDGMADTLRQRIRDLKEPEPTGTGLIVLRDALIKKALELEGIELQDKRGRNSRSFDETYATGARAAERVRLDRGIAGPQRDEGRLLR